MSDLFDWSPRPSYPDTPGAKASGTSREAADAIAPRAGRLRDRVLATLDASIGMTADECANAMGETVLAVRPRFSELARMGLITDTGHRRINASGRQANVWRVR